MCIDRFFDDHAANLVECVVSAAHTGPTFKHEHGYSMHADKHKGHARPSSTLLSVQWKLWELQAFFHTLLYSCMFCSGHALHGLDRSCQINVWFVYIAATTAEKHIRCLALLIHKMATQRKHCLKRWWRGACV